MEEVTLFPVLEIMGASDAMDLLQAPSALWECFPVGLLALRKDLSRNHELHCRTHLNNHLPPRSHNAENEIFSLYFTRHQRCSTDITRQHFFVFLSGAHQAVPSVPVCWTGPREVPSRAMRPQSERWGWMERRFQAEWRKARWEKQDQKMMSRKRTYAGEKRKKNSNVLHIFV